MRAMIFHGVRDIRLEDIPEPVCTPGTVKIKPRFNGLCGSDLHCYFDENVATVGGVHALTGETYPLGFGHEFSGIVTEVAEGVESPRVGDKVAVNPVLACSACDPCLSGARNCCRTVGFVGIHGGGGGLSDAIVVPADMACVLPAQVDLELGAIVEPLAVGWHGVGMVKDISAQTHVLILGGGPVGCAVALALKAKGVKNILVSEPSEARANVVRFLGFDTCSPRFDEVRPAVLTRTEGRGPDVVFECAGLPSTFEEACGLVRAKGQVIIMALYKEAFPFYPSGAIFTKEASLHWSLAYTAKDFITVINSLANGYLPDPSLMITKRIPMHKLVEEGLEPLRDPNIGHCKILIDLDA